jgi:hypothetical protein
MIRAAGESLDASLSQFESTHVTAKAATVIATRILNTQTARFERDLTLIYT